MDCSHSGDCGPDVEAWAPLIRKQIDADNFTRKPTPKNIRAELAEYGAWDNEELADDDANFNRIIWIAAGNIQDERPVNDLQTIVNK